MASPDKEWMTVDEAAKAAGCTGGWIRLLLAAGQLEGWKANERAWMVKAEAAAALRETLSSRSVGQRPTKKPVARRRKAR